jgi:nucleotide-binding universal stress UspA family protein
MSTSDQTPVSSARQDAPRDRSGTTVLIALDESPVSVRAAREAVRLLAPLPAVSFLAVNVARIPVPWVGTSGFGAAAPMLVSGTWTDAAQVPVTDDEQALLDSARAVGVPDPSVEVRAGDAAEQICAAADEHDVDVIVVGSHDKSALRRLFDPSVADGVVHGTRRPVLVVSGEARA